MSGDCREPGRAGGTAGSKQCRIVRPNVRSLRIDEWPAADRAAWDAACRPAERLKRGGAASHMKPVTRHDLAQRYGSFLDHISRHEGLCPDVDAAAYVTPDRVRRYVDELKARVSSVTTYGSIYKLRRMAQLLAPGQDFLWLTEIEKDLALVMEPRSKFDRLVWCEVLVEAGMTLMVEADRATRWPTLTRARQFRDGLMIALLALAPIRAKNFTALELRRTFVKAGEVWWILLPATETKEGRADHRPVPELLIRWIDRYLDAYRPTLARTEDANPFLWLSSTDGRAMSDSAIHRSIGTTTEKTVGVNLSSHLFRTAGASTCAVHGTNMPYLATALLHHTHPAVTQEHYIRAGSLSAARALAEAVKALRDND